MDWKKKEGIVIILVVTSFFLHMF